VRPDFWELLDYSIDHQVGVKFSTNGIKLDRKRAAQLARTDYVDVQISLDGATAESTTTSAAPAPTPPRCARWRTWPRPGSAQPKISVVMTRQNVDQLDEFAPSPTKFGAQLRITRLRPSGAGATCGTSCTRSAAQQRQLYDWLVGTATRC
jgi:MoaA/NifB/PqqE/SkfB family radical SAM enzyme